MKMHRNMKPLPKVVSCVVVLVSFVGAFLIVTDKREVILAYASVALMGIPLFLVQKAREKNALQKPWQYNLARFFSIYLPFSLFFGWSPRLPDASLGARLTISAIVSAMVLAGTISQENRWRNRDD